MPAHIYTVKFQHGERRIFRCVQAAEHTAGQTEAAFLGILQRRICLRCQSDVFQLKALFELVKREHCVHFRVKLLLFSGNASADMYDFRIGHPTLDVLCVCNHGRDHRSQIWNQLRVIFLHKRNDGRAGGRDDDIVITFRDQQVIVLFYDGSTDSRLFHSGKADGLQSFRDAGKTDTEKCRKSRIDTGDHRPFALLDQDLGDFLAVYNAFRIMRTDTVAFTAEHAHVADDVCLMTGIPDRLCRTIPDTAMAVSAICFH